MAKKLTEMEGNDIRLDGKHASCKLDLIRRKLFTTISIKNDIFYFPTSEGNVVVMERERQLTLTQLEQLSKEIPNCILAIISQDTSIVYYGISPIALSFKK